MSLNEIKGQQTVLQLVENGLKHDTLSQSLLFHGPSSSGKMTLAFMIAKALNCTEKEHDYCDECQSCRKINHFSHPDIYIVNNENTLQKIHSLAKYILQTENSRLLNQWIFFCREVLYRLRSQFFTLKTSYKTIKKNVNQLFELSSDLESGPLVKLDQLKNQPLEKETIKLMETTLKSIEIVYHFINSGNIPIDTIKAINQHMFRTPVEGKCKVFIINDIQSMRLESANTFLKNLEEPPKSNQIILITEDIEHILPTIRSRCYQLRFRSLSVNVLMDILQNTFRMNMTDDKIFELRTRSVDHLMDYLQESGEKDKLIQSVNDFFYQVVEKYRMPFVLNHYVKSFLSSNTKVEKFFLVFIDFLSEVKKYKYGYKETLQSPFKLNYIERMSRLPDKALNRLVQLLEHNIRAVSVNNVNAELAFESTFLRMASMYYQTSKNS